jgi:hypothetical protein
MNSSSADNAVYDAAFTSDLAPQTVNRDPGPPPNYSNGFSADRGPIFNTSDGMGTVCSFGNLNPLLSPIPSDNPPQMAFAINPHDSNFPESVVGSIRGGGSIIDNGDFGRKSQYSASVVDSTDLDSVSIVNDKVINTSVKDIHDSILYGDKKGLNTSNNSFDAHVPNPFTSRSSFNVQVIDDYDKSIEKANHGYTSEGPPILPDIVNLQIFQEWQSDLFDFVERLTNYCAGMLFHKPNFAILSQKDQRRLCNLFKMVHGYLKKAGAKNKKIRTVTANVSTYPYPDIVQWWAEVNTAFQLTTKEIDDLVEELNHIQQRPEESCMDYLLRYQSKANELSNIGRRIPDEEQGRQCLKGMHSKYRYNVLQFFAIEKIYCNIKYFRQLCHVQDEYARDSVKITKENELAANMATPSPYSRRNRKREIYGPASYSNSNSMDKPNNEHQSSYQSQGKRNIAHNKSRDTRSDSRDRWSDNRRKERQDLYRSVSRERNSSRGENRRDVRRSDSRDKTYRQSSNDDKSRHSKSKGDDRFYTLEEMGEKDNSSSNFRSPFPCNPTEGMTMTYTKLANGEYTWVIPPLSRGDKSDYNKPRRSDNDCNSNNNLNANLTFEYEKVINFGDF